MVFKFPKSPTKTCPRNWALKRKTLTGFTYPNFDYPLKCI